MSPMSDFIKLNVCVELLESRLGVNIFPRIGYGCQFSTLLLESLRAVVDMAVLNKQSAVLRQLVNIGKTEPFVYTYLERSSSRLHDGLLKQF